MIYRFLSPLIAMVFIMAPVPALAQDSGIQVVPIGETIKPEKGTTRRRRRAPSTVVKPGTTFIIETATALSSGLTQEGEVVLIKAGEDVGSSRLPVITMGAPGQGTVVEVDKKGKKLKVRLDTIESVKGEDLQISGEINLTGDKDHAAASVGERFTATLDEKVVVRRSRKKPKVEVTDTLIGYVEVSGKGAQADLKKGKAKGKVKTVVEAPKGFTSDDIKTETVALYKVNGFELPQPVLANARKPKQGDANKNGTSDWTLYFDAWEFIRNQPKGTNTINVKGQLKNGSEFDAVTRVKIGY